MKIRRTRGGSNLHPDMRVIGGGEDKAVPSLGAGIAVAAMRAGMLPEPGEVVVKEYGEVVARAERDEDGIVTVKEAA